MKGIDDLREIANYIAEHEDKGAALRKVLESFGVLKQPEIEDVNIYDNNEFIDATSRDESDIDI